MDQAKIGIIMGSQSDWPVVEKALKRLESLQIPVTVRIASAHRTPQAVDDWLEEAEASGVEVVIAAAGMAAALPGVVAAKTLLPVIGVPLESGPLSGVDALHSIVQMPPGIPVATVGINGVRNALILATHILGIKYPEYKEKLAEYRKAGAEKVEAAQDDLISRFPRYALGKAAAGKPAGKNIPAGETPDLKAGQGKGEKKESPVLDLNSFVGAERIEKIRVETGIESAPKGSAPSRRKTYRLNPDKPEFQTVEKAADVILEGGVIAIPTDTVYGLACDSTNANAVKRIFDLKGRDSQKALPVLVDGVRSLSRMMLKMTPQISDMLRDLWPGALTVVFPKPENMLRAAAPGNSIAVRIPDNTIALSVISMAARPLAVTSANPSGKQPAVSAAEVKKYFADKLDMILDGGETPGPIASTVLSVTEEPYKILREGLISFDALRHYVNNLQKP